MSSERDRLVETHASLVRSIAGKLLKGLGGHVDLEDLVAAGTKGLLEAADRYDPARGVAFATFAYYRIRGAMFDEIRRMAWLPRRAWERTRFLEKADEVAEGALPPGPAPTGPEAARALGGSLAEIAVAYVVTVETFERIAGGGESPEATVVGGEERAVLRAALARLPEKERTLLELHYFEDLSLEKAGSRLGLSKSWASRLHARALRLLREQLSQASGR